MPSARCSPRRLDPIADSIRVRGKQPAQATADNDRARERQEELSKCREDRGGSGKETPPIFFVITDTGERWTSADGLNWQREAGER
jgi:hypothetical protein